MKNSFKSNDELKEEEVLKMIDDTSKLVAKKNINVLAHFGSGWIETMRDQEFFLVIIRCRNIFHKELEKRNGL